MEKQEKYYLDTPLINLEQLISIMKRVKLRVNIFSTLLLIDDQSVLENRWSTVKFWPIPTLLHCHYHFPYPRLFLSFFSSLSASVLFLPSLWDYTKWTTRVDMSKKKKKKIKHAKIGITFETLGIIWYFCPQDWYRYDLSSCRAKYHFSLTEATSSTILYTLNFVYTLLLTGSNQKNCPMSLLTEANRG